MFELSLAELDGEMAVELPARELMSRVRVSHSFNHNNVSVIAFGSIHNTSVAKNVFTYDSSASSSASVSIYVSQGD
jgi:hypothetical protein